MTIIIAQKEITEWENKKKLMEIANILHSDITDAKKIAKISTITRSD